LNLPPRGIECDVAILGRRYLSRSDIGRGGGTLSFHRP
jgi:hypothetical protein